MTEEHILQRFVPSLTSPQATPTSFHALKNQLLNMSVKRDGGVSRSATPAVSSDRQSRPQFVSPTSTNTTVPQFTSPRTLPPPVMPTAHESLPIGIQQLCSLAKERSQSPPNSVSTRVHHHSTHHPSHAHHTPHRHHRAAARRSLQPQHAEEEKQQQSAPPVFASPLSRLPGITSPAPAVAAIAASPVYSRPAPARFASPEGKPVLRPPSFQSPTSTRFPIESTSIAASDSEVEEEGEEEDSDGDSEHVDRVDMAAWAEPGGLRRPSPRPQSRSQTPLSETAARAVAAFGNSAHVPSRSHNPNAGHSPSPFNDSFHSPHFTTAGQRAPFVHAKRANAFHLQQPADFGLFDKSSSDEEEEEALSAAAATAEAAAAPDESDVEMATDGEAPTQIRTAPAPSIELQYEYLQQALHKLQQNYTEQLAADVSIRMQEFEVALGLAVGIEPEEEVLAQLASVSLSQPNSAAPSRDASLAGLNDCIDASPSPLSPLSSPTASSLLNRSRLHAQTHQVGSLHDSLVAHQSRAIRELQDAFSQIQHSHSEVESKLREKLTSTEKKISDILHSNHAKVTELRDRTLAEKRKAELAAIAEAEAERKRQEEERLTKEAEEKAAAEKKAAEEKAAAEAKAKAEADAKASADKEAASKAAADAKTAAAAAAVKSATSSAAAAASSGGAGAGASANAQAEMGARVTLLQTTRASFAPLLKNLALKKALFEIKMSVNRTMSQISATQSQVRLKAEELLRLLQTAQQAGAEQYSYCLELIAGKLVSFTKARVADTPSAAFPYALTALFIALKHATFTDIFLAMLREKCPYITPEYLIRKDYPTQHAYFLAQGYDDKTPEAVEGQPPPAPQVEPEDLYLRSMGGYVCMYAAFLEVGASEHPHGIDRGWIWVARVLNQAPRYATATILDSFLRTAGHSLNARFPHQFPKLLKFINDTYVAKMDETTDPRKAALARLKGFLKEASGQLQATGQLIPPEGKNMPISQESDASYQQIHAGEDRA